jgi:rod shape-determining protein MreD
MMAVRLIARFVGLVLIQVLILNQVYLFGVATPYVYPLFILLLPIHYPRWLTLTLAMVIGLTIDAFSNTGGIHAFATVFLAFARPALLAILTPREGYEQGDRPNPASLGITWFISYIGMGMLIHHVVYFGMEILSLAYLWFMVKRMVASWLVSLGVILLLQLLFYPRKPARSH